MYLASMKIIIDISIRFSPNAFELKLTSTVECCVGVVLRDLRRYWGGLGLSQALLKRFALSKLLFLNLCRLFLCESLLRIRDSRDPQDFPCVPQRTTRNEEARG